MDLTEHKLGETTPLINLDMREDFINLILCMSQQVKHRIRIFSHDLDKSLYGSNELYEVIKQLAIQNHRNKIQILVQDSLPMTRNGHPLLRLSQRVSRNVSIKKTSREYKDIAKTFILFDDCGYIFQEHPDRYEGSGNFSSRAETKILIARFHEMWEHGVVDSSLRNLEL